ncbi:hypothetical protein [Methanosarcina acetivorans]|uniref:hypothetical protein n=1 Tax=Methanosarcina acetivorans TaxID=2214 RepID=UPI0012FE82D5|nr:hypothetical protein [Methanosarcina acetivorans]
MKIRAKDIPGILFLTLKVEGLFGSQTMHGHPWVAALEVLPIVFVYVGGLKKYSTATED